MSTKVSHPIRRRAFGRLTVSAILSAGMALLSMAGCHSSYQSNPMVPPSATMPPTTTPTVTATYVCTYSTIILPGTYTNTLAGIGFNSTPTITPTPASSFGSRGVIRNASDWYSYCALAGLSSSTAPPVDLSKKMIIYRSRLSPECPTTTQVLGLDCRSDMLVMSIHNLTDRSLICAFSVGGYFEGYIVDQDPRPVFWLDYNETIGTITWPCVNCYYPMGEPVLRPAES